MTGGISVYDASGGGPKVRTTPGRAVVCSARRGPTGRANRSINRGIARASAQISGEADLHLLHRRFRTERHRRHDHPGRADPALGSTVLDKRVLQRMTPTQSFDGGDASAVDLHERHEARIDGKAVNQHCARAALAFATPFLRARETAVLSQHVEQTRHRMRANVGAFTVQREAHAA